MKLVLTQDNDPRHIEQMTRQYLNNDDVQVLNWPPRSPNLKKILEELQFALIYSAKERHVQWHFIHTFDTLHTFYLWPGLTDTNKSNIIKN